MNPLPAGAAAFLVELAAWWLARRRIDGLLAGRATWWCVLCEVALAYGVLGAWTAAEGVVGKCIVAAAGMAGALAGWGIGKRR